MRGRGHKIQLADFWEEHLQTGKLRCKICAKYDIAHTWLARNSRKGHESGATHLANVKLKEVAETKQAHERAQLQAILNGAPILLQPQAPDPSSLRSFNMQFDESIPGYESDSSDHNAPSSGGDKARVDDLEWLIQYFDEQCDMSDIKEDSIGAEDSGGDDLGKNAEDFQTQRVAAVLSDWDHQKSNWFPYPNKTMFLIDLLDNLPRPRLSKSHLVFLFWMLKQLGVQDVPSIDQLRDMQKKLKDQCGGITTQRFQSDLGNIFYVNELAELIAQDYSNPQTAPLLEFYPEETDSNFSEIWQGRKIREMDPDLLTPMVRKGMKDYYVKELAETKDGVLVIPIRWLRRNGKLFVNAYCVENIDGCLYVQTCTQININVDDFRFNFLDLQVQGDLLWSGFVGNNRYSDTSFSFASQMPNRLRDLAKGDELYTSWVVAWADDVGGNVSKQYNAHKNFYVTHGNLPGQLLQREFHVRFASTSPHASTAEQAKALREMVNKSHEDPIQAYNAATGRVCCFRMVVPMLPADNPQQAEESSQIGPNGNCKCRKCKCGGPATYVESDEGFHLLHEPGDPRTTEDTLIEIKAQIDLAAEGRSKPVQDRQTNTGIKDKVTQGWIVKMKDKYKAIQLLQPELSPIEIKASKSHGTLFSHSKASGLDPHRDTPVELLHTMLLGIVKYVWHNVNQTWSDTERATFLLRLQSTDISGMNIPPIRAGYMIQYRNSLIGKQFRVLMQLMLFHVHDLLNEPRYTLIKTIGRLGALLWFPEIQNLEEYLEDVEIAIANVLDAFDSVDGGHIIDKMKIHLLVHIPEDIRNHGPLVRSETEQSSGTIQRHCCQVSRMDFTKHIVCGGYWYNKITDEWNCAGPGVRETLENHSLVQRLLGWAPHIHSEAGSFTRYPQKHTEVKSWQEWNIHSHSLTTPMLIPPEAESQWESFKSVTAQNGDECCEDFWVIAQLHEEPPVIGRISKILRSRESSERLVMLKHYQISESRHPRLDLPLLSFPPCEMPWIAINGHEIICSINVQHDCSSSECGATGVRPIIQEREKTTRNISFIEHKNEDIFVLNLFTLHNAHIIQRLLPRSLTSIKPLHVDRRKFHDGVAETVRITRNCRRKTAAEKRQAKSKSTNVEPALISRKRKRGITGEVLRNEEGEADDETESEAPPPEDSEDEYRNGQDWSDGGGCSGEDDSFNIPVPIRSRRAHAIKQTKF
ncbi:hypothetical protein M422DRAFT_49166 [Sphaerobolus stellatus SS14]|uniref:Uncharacterized protein n=1 Tax=Sphaerobolus stellatus (strain SS14) TaxID=990650 RepID=A0A0C9VR95_SPHS4|nr:hypothetical protein M422DRAFT_49166 [Sphaerobolus stellatus SS14]